MTQLLAADSFIVRIYRVDSEDKRKLTGIVESMDGSEERAPFTDSDELAGILSRGSGKSKKRLSMKYTKSTNKIMKIKKL